MDIMGKFLSMRKPQKFIVYPRPTNVDDSYNSITVQSDKSIGRFDADTGIGILNLNSKYLLDSGQTFTFPLDFVAACRANQPKKGDKIGNVLHIG